MVNIKENAMKKLLCCAAIGVLAAGLTACDHPAERTGEAVDSAAYSAKSTVQDVTGTKGPAQSAGESVDNAVNTTSQ
jgi:hypothetical protein